MPAVATICAKHWNRIGVATSHVGSLQKSKPRMPFRMQQAQLRGQPVLRLGVEARQAGVKIKFVFGPRSTGFVQQLYVDAYARHIFVSHNEIAA